MSKKYDYSKSDIANIVEEFKALLAEHECVDDVCIYYNNKRTRYIRNLWDKEEKKYVPLNTWIDDVEGVHPTKYCEYAPSTNIISFSSEGTLCDYMYSGAPEWLEEFALKYGMYIECATSWFFYFAPCMFGVIMKLMILKSIRIIPLFSSPLKIMMTIKSLLLKQLLRFGKTFAKCLRIRDVVQLDTV